MIEVYRIEHRKKGVGPYQTDHPFTQSLTHRLAAHPERFPPPGKDGLGLANIPFHYVFGCPTIDDLKHWFLLGSTDEENKEIVEELDKLGFCLKYYVVEEDNTIMGLSGKQIAFSNSTSFDDCLYEEYSVKDLIN